jgi:hypothetical protein
MCHLKGYEKSAWEASIQSGGGGGGGKFKFINTKNLNFNTQMVKKNNDILFLIKNKIF